MRHFLFAALTCAVACSEPAAESDSETQTSGLRGELVVIVEEGPEGGMRRFLRQADREELLPLRLEDAELLPSGTPIAVWGEMDGDVLHVRDHEVIGEAVDGVGSLQEPLLNPVSGKARTFGYAPVDFGAGLEVSREKAQTTMFSTTNPGPSMGLRDGDKSLVQYYDEVSYGQLKITGSVTETLSYSASSRPCNGSGGATLASTLRSRIGTDFDHILFYYGSDVGCGSGGWGEQGSWARPRRNAWMTMRYSGTFIPHELGHNLGLLHASSIRCGNVPLADDPRTCTTTEYGNPVTIMGNSGVAHVNAVEKWYFRWFDGCNAVRVRSSGTFTLFPIETPCDGIQVLQIPMPKTTRTFTTQQSSQASPARYYYLELRAPVGLDTNMRPAGPTVLVHISDEISPEDRSCARNAILDMNPASANSFDGMTQGMTYTDPAGGLSFRVDSLSAESATIAVTITNGSGASTCMDMSSLVGSGPTSCSGTNGGAGGSAGAGGASSGGMPNGGSAGAGIAGSSSGGRASAGSSSGGSAGGPSGTSGGSVGGAAGSFNGGASGTSNMAGGPAVSGAGGATTGGTGGTGGLITSGTGGNADPSTGTAGTIAVGGASLAGNSGLGGGLAGVPSGIAGNLAQAGTGIVQPAAPADDAGCTCGVVPARNTSSGLLQLIAVFGVALGGIGRRYALIRGYRCAGSKSPCESLATSSRLRSSSRRSVVP